MPRYLGYSPTGTANSSVTNSQSQVDKKYNSGIWSLNDVFAKRKAGNWPSSTRDGDLYYNSTSLILNFEGSNGDTTTSDESPVGHTITFNGGAQISTAQSASGSSSVLFNGVGDYLSIADDTSLQLGGDFTIEFSFYALSAPNTFGTLLALQDPGHDIGGGGAAAQLFGFFATGGVTFYSDANGSTPYDITQPLFTGLSTETWYTVALTRSSNTYYYYLDGTRIGTFTNSLTPVTGHPTVLGARSDVGGGQDFKGYIDQVRITKGVARYTGASYVVPTDLYTSY